MKASRRHFYSVSLIITFLIAAVLPALVVAPLYASVTVPRILVLNSYSPGYDWSDDEMEGVLEGLSKAFSRSEIFVEYLDTKKFPAKKHFPVLADLLETKYAKRQLDVIIAMDNAALEFASRYRQRISPGTALVFCGVNDYVPAMIAGQSKITGVAEYHDSVGTLELALRLHPGARDVIVIHDYTDTGLAIRNELEKSAGRFPTLKLHFMEEMPLEETVKKLKAIAPGQFVLMLSYTVEKGGLSFSHSEAAGLVSSASPVPVYSVYAPQLGHGVVGGRVIEGQTQGKKAAELAARIIGGETAEKLPVITTDLSRLIFDYPVLKKFDINPAKLPADAAIINKPSSTFAINKTAVWLGFLFTLLCTISLIVLTLNIRKRRRLEELLRLKIDEYQESQEELLATEEMLRAQVDEYIQSQDELQATEEMLREQIGEYRSTHDQLLATEEMLRVQLEAVETSSQKFKAVFEHSPITIALTTLPDGTFYEVNQAFVDMFGFSREESIGKTTLDLGVWVHDADRKQYLQTLREKKYVSNFEAEMRRKGGEEFAAFFSGIPLEIAGRSFVLSTVMDISEQKRLQNQVNQTQKMDVLGQLAGGIAHDFNNMLAGIMASAELLKLRMTGDDKNLKMVNTILQAATRSADLTREMLSFSRKNSGLSSQVSINDTIAAVANLLEHTIDKRVQLKTCLWAQDPVVKGDQTLLQNALLNLGVNARDAMPDGGTLTFATTEKQLDEGACRTCNISLRPGSYLEISVSDTGVGMTKAVIERIFEPFFTTKETGKGTGLGLAAVYGTVKNHGGDITVHSQPGLGSVFKIFLPLVKDETGNQINRDVAVTGSGGILLVDDEEMLRSVGRELLEDLGYTVYLAENGEQAQEVFSAHRNAISLIILDMIMPKMGGKEAFLRFLKEAPDVKVLFCSGFHQEGTEEELLKLGASGFIHKPYNQNELSRAVAEALRL